jgi:hypothetical protein
VGKIAYARLPKADAHVNAILPTLRERLAATRPRRDNPAKLTHQIVRHREATLMHYTHRATSALGAVASLTIISLAWAQDSAPTNSLPNPYRSIENWAKMLEGRVWGSTSGIDVDRDGKSIWVAGRRRR